MKSTGIARFGIYVSGSLRLGGAERRFFRIYRHLAGRGVDVHMATSEDGATACRQLGIELPPESSRVFPAPRGGRIGAYTTLLAHALGLVRWVRGAKIQRLHFGQNPSAITFLYALLSSFGCPFSVSLVDPVKDYQRNWREKLYVRLTARLCERIDCLSSAIKDDLIAFLGPRIAEKCVVAPCSFTEPRAVDDSVVRDIDIALIARMIPWKGHSLLRDALARLEESGLRGIVVQVCGSGPLEEQIRRDFAALKHQRVEVRYEKDPFQILQRSRIFVSLQDVENYPSQSLLEAMSCGCGIVATDVGLTRLLIDETSGILVAPDAGMLANALRRLLTEETLRERLGRAAQRVVNTQQTIARFADYFVRDVIRTDVRKEETC